MYSAGGWQADQTQSDRTGVTAHRLWVGFRNGTSSSKEDCPVGRQRTLKATNRVTPPPPLFQDSDNQDQEYDDDLGFLEVPLSGLHLNQTRAATSHIWQVIKRPSPAPPTTGQARYLCALHGSIVETFASWAEGGEGV